VVAAQGSCHTQHIKYSKDDIADAKGEKRTTGSTEVTASGSNSRVLPYTNINYRKDDIADDKREERGPLVAER
jgi:hypothetical protein